MRLSVIGIGLAVVAAVVGTAVVSPERAWSQAPAERLQRIEQQLAQKQAAVEAHRQQMEGIKDQRALDTEMRKHFQMTEDMLALMLERKKLTASQAPTGGARTPQAAMPSESGGMQGGGMEHGSGMRGGMMQKEMGGMQGGMMERPMGGMQGGATPGMGAASPSTASGSPGVPMSDMDQMMKRITEHSTYMETVNDPATFRQEMLRHQKMLDQMLQLMR